MPAMTARPIRDALAVASYALLAGNAHPAQAREHWNVDSGVLDYSEKDRVSVVEPAVNANLSLGDDENFNVKFVYDTMSGASPNGATATDKTQTFSSASGGNQYIAGANQLPMRTFSDERVAGSLEWDKRWHRTSRSILGASASTENDYASLGLSATFALDMNRKLTTLSMGAALDADQVRVRGTFPGGLTQTTQIATFTQASGSTNTQNSNDGNSGNAAHVETRDKTLWDFFVGVSQVLNRRTLTQLNYSYGLSNGYLTDPYKIISVIDGSTGETMNYRYEKRPDARTRQSLYWKTVVHLPRDVVHFSYRYYWDDWNIASGTFDLTYRMEFGRGIYLAPHARRYTQSAAEFYRYSLIDGPDYPRFASADYRLAAMRSNTYGFKLGIPLAGHSELGVRAEYLRETGEQHPADAIGVQRNQDLYPGLQATIFSLTYTTKF